MPLSFKSHVAIEIGSRFGPYEVTALIGAGGMGRVYKAHDPRLQRPVAIKVLTEQNADASAQLLDEARAASALDHPNVCTVYEVGDHEGLGYIAMAYVAGKPLRDLVPDDGLPAKSVLLYAAQIAEALAHAHERGVVHRDLKSQNVVVTPEGRAIVLDFGLAARMPRVDADAVTRTLQATPHDGRIAGTLTYMAPELLRGRPATPRSDVWALGVLLFEMASGTLPFTGATAVEATAAALKEAPPALPSRVPSGLRAVVERALAKEPAQRYANAGELRAALEVATTTSGTGSAARDATPSQSPSLAVLPFTDMSPERDQAYFCEGIAEELIDALARLDGMRIVARTSAFQFRDQALDLRDVGEKLNVETVLEGSVRKAGNRLRINVQLINAADGYHLWSERYDRELDDVFAVQDDIARTVVAKLEVELLGAADAPLIERPTVSMEAFHLYLKGRQAWQRATHEGYETAIEYLHRALDVDPTYSQAYGELGVCYASFAFMGHQPPREVYPKVKAAAQQAVELDPSSAEAHTALGMYHCFHTWEWEQAERHFRQAVAHNPGHVMGHVMYAHLLIALGEASRGLTHIERAQELDPISVETGVWAGDMMFFAGQTDRAIAQLEQTRALSPDHTLTLIFLGIAYHHKGLHRRAIEILERGTELAGHEQSFLAFLGLAYGAAGRRSEAEKIMAELEELGSRTYLDPTNVAFVLMGLGDADGALDWLERAYEDRAGWMAWLKSFPLFDPLREHPRFEDLVRRLKYPNRVEAATHPRTS